MNMVMRTSRDSSWLLMTMFSAVSVDFIGADMDEPSDLNPPVGPEEDVDDIHIVLGELGEISEGPGNKVHDGVDGLSGQQVAHKVDTSLDHTHFLVW